VPHQNQGRISAKVDKPTGVKQRLMRGLSDTFGSSLSDLPQTREEVIEVNEIVGKDGVVLLVTDATETAFKSAPLADFKIIHIAVHGFADTQFPERSGLVLGVDPTSHDDGLLQVREIIRLGFKANLVTLSACNTGIGKLQGEEGVISLYFCGCSVASGRASCSGVLASVLTSGLSVRNITRPLASSEYSKLSFSNVMRIPSTERSRGTSPSVQFTCSTPVFVVPDTGVSRIRNIASPPVGKEPERMDSRLEPIR
jgi:hypothetical protein